MKPFLFVISFLLIFSTTALSQKPNPDYDSVLVKKLGADQRGMKMYVLVLLKTGPNKSQDSVKISELGASHFRNINKMAAEKKLIVAGPIDKNDHSLRGIFILDVPTIEEAENLINRDLSVKEGIFEAQYFNWYGSAALPEYIPIDNRLRKTIPD